MMGVNMMDVVTVGESMVLLTPMSVGPMRYESYFSSKIAGAESNVAIGLARLGHHVALLTRVGNDEFGKKILTFVRGEGIDVSGIHIDPDAPTGIYFKEKITEEEMNIYYYRKNSAASLMTPNDLDEKIIAQAKYLHITGITPALSDSCAKTIHAAIDIAKEHHVTIVFDPNLRKKLWSEEVARKELLSIASKSDIVLPGIDEGRFLFGLDDAPSLAKAFYDNGAKCVVLKLGADGAYYLNGEQSGLVRGFPVKRVVDPIGAGDGFASGLLSGLIDGFPLEKAVEKANAVGAMVTQVSGDVEGLPEKARLESYLNTTNITDVDR